MISVEDARQNILSALIPVSTETISIHQAVGRVLAEPVSARRTQPPADLSAMDGYAVKAADIDRIPATLNVIGESAAGHGFDGTVEAGTCVRIFTGAPLPTGADTIIIQEDTTRDGDQVTITEGAAKGTYVRPAGLDFTEGEPALTSGHKLTPRDIGLLAAMNIPWIDVYRKPRVALLSTGDELVRPGEPIGPTQIISTNSLVVAAMIEQAGGEAIDLGIAKDNEESLRQMAQGAEKADLLITLGGASVGDHDLVQSVLGKDGLQIDFWRIAMRPGKPLMFGDLAGTPMLGLPGNPVSSMICSYIFLLPALDVLMGRPPSRPRTIPAILSHDVKENDRRQDYVRAEFIGEQGGLPLIKLFSNQDSSLLTRLAKADCLLMRPPHAPALKKRQQVDISLLQSGYPDV